MDQREVETMIKSLQKALAEKEPVANVIAIMEKLKKDVAPTEDLLRVCSLTS
jgi:transcription elongation factor S-II